MSLTIIQPPTIRELLSDPVYRPYLLKAPRLPAASQREGSLPFRVWGIRHDDKWAGKLFPDYREAFGLVKKMLGQPDTYRDVVVTCRPMGFRPPQGFYMEPGLEWCGHCRRPTVYRRMRSHAAMKKWPIVSDDDVRRCYYCAAREGGKVWYR